MALFHGVFQGVRVKNTFNTVLVDNVIGKFCLVPQYPCDNSTIQVLPCTGLFVNGKPSCRPMVDDSRQPLCSASVAPSARSSVACD